MGYYKYLVKLGLSRYCVPEVMNTVSGYAKLRKMTLRTFLRDVV